MLMYLQLGDNISTDVCMFLQNYEIPGAISIKLCTYDLQSRNTSK